MIDVRLNNRSQLAGFAKRDDLAYFLAELCGADYVHAPVLAPTQELLDGYKKKEIPWEDYEIQFVALLEERNVEEEVDRGLFDVPVALLCSEPEADHCHRRLVAEHLGTRWGATQIVHL